MVTSAAQIETSEATKQEFLTFPLSFAPWQISKVKFTPYNLLSSPYLKTSFYSRLRWTISMRLKHTLRFSFMHIICYDAIEPEANARF